MKQTAFKLASGYSIETFFVLLHWNGKMLENMQHIIKSVEHELITLYSNNTSIQYLNFRGDMSSHRDLSTG